jgi:hypothetical protein
MTDDEAVSFAIAELERLRTASWPAGAGESEVRAARERRPTR